MSIDLDTIAKAEKELKQLEDHYKELAADAALTAASFAPPPFGTVADVVSIGKSLWSGDWGGALLDVVGLIPIVGDTIKGATKGTKITAKMDEVADAIKVARAKLARKKENLVNGKGLDKSKIENKKNNCSKEQCNKKLSKSGDDENKGSPKTIKRVEKQKVSCFDKKNKYDKKEYNRQLKNQEDGINKITVDQYLIARSAFSGIKCKDGTIKKDTNWSNRDKPKRDRKKADEVRDQYRIKRKKELKNEGYSETEIDKKLKSEMFNLAALHNPDMIAAGLDMFDTKDITVSMGDSKINSSIGSSWKTRINELDAQACKDKKNGNGKKNMNVELKRCKK